MDVFEYNRCVDRFSDRIYGYILKQIRDSDTAKDIVQESYAKLWIKVDHVPFKSAKSYLYKTAYHTMIDWIRKQKFETSMEYAPHPQTNHAYSDLKDHLDEGLSRLSEIQRSVVLLRDYEGYSYLEIGKILNLNESQVKVYIYRARLALKKYIGKIEVVI
jgi:RNA polymerase sigma-70 factor (ECF subfamily)